MAHLYISSDVASEYVPPDASQPDLEGLSPLKTPRQTVTIQSSPTGVRIRHRVRVRPSLVLPAGPREAHVARGGLWV